MQLTPLSAVRHRIRIGDPLPFGVRSADGMLLLARGQTVENPVQLDALLERGAVIDIAELLPEPAEVQHAPRAALPQLWRRCLGAVNEALQRAPHASFRSALDDAAVPVAALVARDPDLAIFQVLTHRTDPNVAYGARRALNAAITASLVARRLAWTEGEVERAFKAALTMNLSILELCGRLAEQAGPPDEAQRAAIRAHPTASAELLALAGVTDADWLRAVREHHEREDGSGYPSGRRDPSELAGLLRRSELYTAKLATRSTRDALAADLAARQMFMQEPGQPMVAALVKEFGLYPPGCCVRLASGALGIVVERGPAVHRPVVACLSDSRGRPLPVPLRVEAGEGANAIAATVGEAMLPVPVELDELVALFGS